MIIKIKQENIGKSGNNEQASIINKIKTGGSDLIVLNEHPLKKSLDVFHTNLLQPFEVLSAGRSAIFYNKININITRSECTSDFVFIEAKKDQTTFCLIGIYIDIKKTTQLEALQVFVKEHYKGSYPLFICGDANTNADYIDGHLIKSLGGGSSDREMLTQFMQMLDLKQHNNIKNENEHHLDIMLSNVQYGKIKTVLCESLLNNGPVKYHKPNEFT